MTLNATDFALQGLPANALEIIFIHYARHHFFGYHNTSPTPVPPSWVLVSYVCRHWRNVALGCPTLWSYLFVVSPRWTDTLLARSQNAPLKINVTTDTRDKTLGAAVSCFLRQLADHVERIQEFHLCLSPLHEEELDVLSKLFACAPRLRYLSLSVGEPSDIVSSRLLLGDAPALRTLELFNIPVLWHSLRFSRLTSLCLRHIHARFRENTQELLAMLSHLQDLQHLELGDDLASAAGPNMPGGRLLRGWRTRLWLSGMMHSMRQKIDLPRLAHLSISAPLATILVFLSYVDVPRATQVRITSRYEGHASLSGFVHLASLLAPRFHGPDASGRCMRALTVHPTQLVFSTTDLFIDPFLYTPFAEWDAGIPLKIVLCPAVPQTMTTDITHCVLPAMCRVLPLADVHSLQVLSPPESGAFWRTLLGLLKGVRWLTLNHGRMPDLGAVLSPAQGTRRGGGTLVAPVLQMVHLLYMTFESPPGDDPDLLRASDLQSLCDALSQRRESRCELFMESCSIRVMESYFAWSGNVASMWVDDQFELSIPPELRVAGHSTT